MDLMSELDAMNVNTGEAIRRFNNNTALYIKMLGKFPATVAGLEVMPHIKNGEIDAAIANAHTLKGLTGNLSLSPLYAAYTEITNDLREGNIEKAQTELEEILPLQEGILECIKKYNN